MQNIKNEIDKIKPAKIYGSWIFKDTVNYQKQYGFDIGTGEHATWNNEADAFKHTFMQAQLALLGNDEVAKYLGDRHEDDGNKKQGQTKEEEKMDKWNNAQGREIAKEIWALDGIVLDFLHAHRVLFSTLCVCQQNLFAIQTNSLRSCRSFANPLEPI